MKKHISEYSATSSSQWSQGSNYSMMEHEIIREWEGLECLMMDLAIQYLQRILAASHSGRKTVLKDVPMQTIGTVSSRTFELKGEAPVSVLHCPKKFNYRGIEGIIVKIVCHRTYRPHSSALCYGLVTDGRISNTVGYQSNRRGNGERREKG
jgi:hypothetical protein